MHADSEAAAHWVAMMGVGNFCNAVQYMSQAAAAAAAGQLCMQHICCRLQSQASRCGSCAGGGCNSCNPPSALLSRSVVSSFHVDVPYGLIVCMPAAACDVLTVSGGFPTASVRTP